MLAGSSEFIRRQLLQMGAGLYLNALPPDMLAQVRTYGQEQTAGYTLEAYTEGKPSDLDAKAAPVYPDIPELQAVILRGAEILQELGFEQIRWHSGALIPKWKGEGRRCWHVDMWTWEDSKDTWREVPPQVGMLFYLDSATPLTGALILAPGSHRREVPGHYESWEGRQPRADEIVISAEAGDCVLLDPRAMHATTENTSVERRLCLTMWYMVDFEQLEERTRQTVLLSVSPRFDVLGGLKPVYAGSAPYFPHNKMPQFPIHVSRIDALRGGRSDRAIIGDAAQPGDDFLDGDTYSWYFGLGAARAPLRILELGVRYGYALLAMGKGAVWAGCQPELYGVDAESDGIDCNSIAEASLRRHGFEARIFKRSTREMDACNADVNGCGTFDLIHVDGDHSPEGIANELKIARFWVRPKGLIAVDDVDVGYVKAAADQLAAELGIAPLYLPTLHGLLVLDMAKRTHYGY